MWVWHASAYNLNNLTVQFVQDESRLDRRHRWTYMRLRDQQIFAASEQYDLIRGDGQYRRVPAERGHQYQRVDGLNCPHQPGYAVHVEADQALRESFIASWMESWEFFHQKDCLPTEFMRVKHELHRARQGSRSRSRSPHVQANPVDFIVGLSFGVMVVWPFEDP